MARVKILTRKELCELMNILPATMRKNISRKSIIESSPGEINVYNTKNQNWIVDYCDKKSIDYKPIFEKSDKPSYPAKKPTRQQIIVDSELDKKKVVLIEKETNQRSLLNTKELEKKVELKGIETQLKKLELEKKKAKVVPTDLMIELIPIYVKDNINGIVTEGHKQIDKIFDELGGDYETKLKHKKQFKLMVNNVFQKNHNSTCSEISEIAKKYSIDRNW